MNAPWKNLLRSLAVGTLALTLGSCSTQMYSGERLKKDQVARLKEKSNDFMSGYFVTLWEVNGRRVDDSTFGIDVPPGQTRITALLHSPPTGRNPVGYQKVYRTITAKAGHEYTLDGSGGKLVVHEKVNQNLVDKLKKE